MKKFRQTKNRYYYILTAIEIQIILLTMLLLICFNISVYADEPTAVLNIEETDEPTAVLNIEETDEPIVIYIDEPNFVDRIYEWFENNMVEFLSGVGTLLSALFITVIIPYLRSRITYIKTNIDEKISEMNEKLGVNSTNVSNIVDVVNNMIKAYNTVENKLKLLEETNKNSENNTAEAKVLAQTITEILTMVYSNSKNLPQGVKDLISLKYAQALKAIDTQQNDNGGK